MSRLSHALRHMEQALFEDQRDPTNLDLTPPDNTGFLRRGLQLLPGYERPEPLVERQIEAVRESIWDAVLGYWQQSDHTPLLLLDIQPGVGKSTSARLLAEEVAIYQGQPVFYHGPRHAFFHADILPKVSDPGYWQEWLKRQGYDPARGQMIETCSYQEEIERWLSKGHRALNFCRIAEGCGLEYVNEGCAYHAQKKSPELITYGAHEHLVLGNPKLARAALILGDENPLNAFIKLWAIPRKEIVPRGMDRREPFTRLLMRLRDLADRGRALEGPGLLDLLGGAAAVWQTALDFDVDPEAPYMKAGAFDVASAEDAPYLHVPALREALIREAALGRDDKAYIPRIIIKDEQLILIGRNYVHADALDKPLIWLDGSANAALYERMFRRPVQRVTIALPLKGKVYQLWNRANGQTALFEGAETKQQLPFDPPVVESEDELVTPARIKQLRQDVDAILRRPEYAGCRPGIVTFMKAKKFFSDIPGVVIGHFFGERGSNEFEGCNPIIVIGTPLPRLDQIQITARSLFYERDEPFAKVWSTKPVAYNATIDGKTPFYDVSGYWGDSDLQLLVDQWREREVFQSGLRGRSNLHPCDIWLLTNIPIAELPPVLLTEKELFAAPDGVDPFRWDSVAQLAARYHAAHRALTASDIGRELGWKSPTTALKYWEKLAVVQAHLWHEERALSPGQATGRKSKTLRPL